MMRIALLAMLAGCAGGISLSEARHLLDRCEVQRISFGHEATYLKLRDGRAIRYADTYDEHSRLRTAAEQAEVHCGLIQVDVE